MKVEFVNPFIQAGIDVLVQLVGGGVERGQLAARSALFTSQPISIVVGVSGQISGQVIYGMSQVTAIKIAGAMIGAPCITCSEQAVSAIGEFGNIISGNAMRLLAESGYSCDITPPTIIRGVNVEIGTRSAALVVPLYTVCGKLDMHVALADAA